ncbi:hypothetical protein ACWFOS_18890 [Gordonia terrae]
MMLLDSTGRPIEVETFTDDEGRAMVALVAGPRDEAVIELPVDDLALVLGV